MKEFKAFYEVQGDVPPQYCVDGKKSSAALDNLIKKTDEALDKIKERDSRH